MVAIVILVLITISIAGLTYSFIAGYWGSLTQETIEVTIANCLDDGVSLQIHNMGSEAVTGPDVSGMGGSFQVLRTVIGNSSSLSPVYISPESVTINPQQTAAVKDINCNGTDHIGVTCKYDIIPPSGRKTTMTVTC